MSTSFEQKEVAGGTVGVEFEFRNDKIIASICFQRSDNCRSTEVVKIYSERFSVVWDSPTVVYRVNSAFQPLVGDRMNMNPLDVLNVVETATYMAKLVVMWFEENSGFLDIVVAKEMEEK